MGQLYDEIVGRADKKYSRDHFHGNPAIAGRIINKKGQLLCFLNKSTRPIYKDIYRPEIAERFDLFAVCERNEIKNSELLSFAFAQRFEYEDILVSYMNKYHINSEGELWTGCILKFHKLNQRRQYDLATEVQRQTHILRVNFRESFLIKVISMFISLNQISEKEMLHYIAWADVVASVSSEKLDERISKVRNLAELDAVTIEIGDHKKFREFAGKLAAAYYVVTFHPLLQRIDDQGESNFKGNEIELLAPLMSAKKDLIGSHVLFSFPHIVYDILNIGFREISNNF